MEQTTGKRLIELRKAKGLSVEEFAAKLGIKPSAVYGLQSDANKPSFDTLASIIHTFPDVSMDWLLTGAGPMLRDGVALTKKEPMLPGGDVNFMGATEREPGSRPHIEMEEQEGYTAPSQKPTPVPKNDREFIDILVNRIKKLEEQVATEQADKARLYRIIEEQQGTVRFLQQQLGKYEGNQLEAPGTHTPEPQAPIGFQVPVRAMYPDGLPDQEPEVLAA